MSALTTYDYFEATIFFMTYVIFIFWRCT